MTTQEMAKRQNTPTVSREEPRSAGRVLMPAVDILESDAALTLVADMPKVSPGKPWTSISIKGF